MRYAIAFLALLAACDSKPPTPPPAPPPPAPPPAPPAPAAAPTIDPRSPLQAADLEALGFPKDVVLSDFGSNPQALKFSVHSPTHPLRLNFEVHTLATDAEAEERYTQRRDSRAGADPELKDENKYGKKSYFSKTQIVFAKGPKLGVIAASDPEAQSKPGDLEKLIRGVAERLSK